MLLPRLTKEIVCKMWLDNGPWGRSLVGPQSLGFLLSAAAQVSEAGVPGWFAEVGVYKGGTLRAWRDCYKERNIVGFDTFTGIPGEKRMPELDFHAPGDFVVSIEEVRDYCGPSIALVAGLFPESAARFENEKFALVHVDTDLYQTTADCIQWFRSRMSPSGLMIFDDYNNAATPGVPKALQECGLSFDVINGGIQACIVF